MATDRRPAPAEPLPRPILRRLNDRGLLAALLLAVEALDVAAKSGDEAALRAGLARLIRTWRAG